MGRASLVAEGLDRDLGNRYPASDGEAGRKSVSDTVRTPNCATQWACRHRVSGALHLLPDFLAEHMFERSSCPRLQERPSIVAASLGRWRDGEALTDEAAVGSHRTPFRLLREGGQGVDLKKHGRRGSEQPQIHAQTS